MRATNETIPFDLSHKIFDNANGPKLFYEIRHCHVAGPRYYADSISEKMTGMLK